MALTQEMMADINAGGYGAPQDNMGRAHVLANKLLGLDVAAPQVAAPENDNTMKFEI